MMAFSGVTSQCEERGFRRSAGTNFEIAVAVVPAGTKCFSLLRKTTGRWSVNIFWTSGIETIASCNCDLGEAIRLWMFGVLAADSSRMSAAGSCCIDCAIAR